MDSAGGNVNGDQKVTNAVVKRDLDDLRATMRDLVMEMREHNRTSEARFQLLEKADAVQDKTLEQITEDVNALKNRDTAGTVTTGFLAALAGLIAIFKP